MTLNTFNTWVLLTDSNTCRFFQYNKKDNQLTLLKEISHPENRLRDIELTADKPGKYKSWGGAIHGSFTQRTDPKEVKIDDFARNLAKELDHDRCINAYQQLIVIAPPHMNGLLSHHFNKHVKELISHTIEKDIIHYNERELLDFLHQHVGSK